MILNEKTLREARKYGNRNIFILWSTMTNISFVFFNFMSE
jgi:hypothetical protein